MKVRNDKQKQCAADQITEDTGAAPKHNSEKIVTNILWRFAEKWLEQIIRMVVSLVLARLLVPEAYGVISLITVFTTVLDLLVDSGFANALIQKKDADQLDYSTVFWFSLSFSVLLYGLMFLAAPSIARFYTMEFIIPHLRVMSLTLVLSALIGVPRTIVVKRMAFKKLFFSSLLGTLLSGIVGIYMAFKGYGAWALVAMSLINRAVDGLFLWILVRWKPSLQFSWARWKLLFHFGGKLMVSSVLNALSEKLSALLIGRIYTAADLAYYDKGDKIPRTLVYDLQQAAQTVLFPALAEEQDDRQKVRSMLRKSILIGAYCFFPMMLGLGICADSLVILLYTEKWEGLIPYLKLYCVIYSLGILNAANLQVLKALGRSDIFLRLEIVKKILGLAVLAVSLPFGVLPMLSASCAFSVVAYFINAYPNRKLVEYGFWSQIKDLIPIILLNLVMGAAVWLVGRLQVSLILKLVIQIAAGVAVYAAGSSVFHLESAVLFMKTVRKLLHRKRETESDGLPTDEKLRNIEK